MAIIHEAPANTLARDIYDSMLQPTTVVPQPLPCSSLVVP
jgi:hypothetical protein